MSGLKYPWRKIVNVVTKFGAKYNRVWDVEKLSCGHYNYVNQSVSGAKKRLCKACKPIKEPS